MLKAEDLLSWNADLGYGFFPVDPGSWPYDEAYRAKYEAMASSVMAERLNFHRVGLALKAAEMIDRPNIVPSFLDVGPGDGAYMRALSADLMEGEDFSFGFDVNPAMIERLKEDKRWGTPDNGPWSVMTFWDSFEHIHRPDLTIRKAQTVAMSIPIFRNREHVLASKHFRPDEHVWYFTHEGIKAFMLRCGFVCAHHDTHETKLGRDDIGSYIFVRVQYAQSQP